MQFTRISITQKEVTLNWRTPRAGGGTIEHELVDRARPLPAFAAAMQAFAGFALQLIGAPATWDEGLRVTTLNLHENKDGRRGFQVSFNHPVDRARGASVSITTPTLWEADQPGGEISDGFYGTHVIELIEAAEAEALRYQKGEKEQTQLALAESDAAPAKPKGKGSAKKPKDFIPGVGDITNADKSEVVTDDRLRQMLLQVERDVPIDAIARWTSGERDAAQRWSTHVVEAVLRNRPATMEEPACVKRDATLPLSAEEHHATVGAEG